MNAHERGCYVDDAGICTCGLPIPDQSDTLAQAQAKAAEEMPYCNLCKHAHGSEEADVHIRKFNAQQWPNAERRCIFHHSVPANQGYEIRAGFCCFAHSGEFDNAG